MAYVISGPASRALPHSRFRLSVLLHNYGSKGIPGLGTKSQRPTEQNWSSSVGCSRFFWAWRPRRDAWINRCSKWLLSNWSYIICLFQGLPSIGCANRFAQLPPRFGLLDQSPDRWGTFKSKIIDLNQQSPNGTQYKVFFLGRHGQGYRMYFCIKIAIWLSLYQ